jgi:KaiC/GvpD/RAD55 family RecA-like ATPase
MARSHLLVNEESVLPPELEAVLGRRGSILLVKGETGTGKTTLALEIMSRLQSEGDTVHISTRTHPDKLAYQHALFPALAARENVKFFSTLEFDPTQFVISHNVVAGLHGLLSSMDNPLVVLDSWEGIADYIPQEARMKVEQSLMAVVEETGARLVLVSEHAGTDTTMDQLADAIIVLHQRVIDDRRVREVEIRKMRGVPIRQERYLFTIASGRFKHLGPFRFTLPAATSKFEPLPNTKTHMSTGSRHLDTLLGGGVPRGSTVLLEIRGDVPFEAQVYVPLTALLNFLVTNNAVMNFPYSDFDPTRARLFATQFLPKGVYDANLRIFTTDRVEDPVAIKFSLNPGEDFDKWLDTYESFKRQGKTLWMVMALDTVQNFYGQGVMNFLATVASRAAVNNDIQSIIARPNLELTPKVANISQIHLVLSQRWGTLILYGVKPRTGFYALQFSFQHGYPEFELVPLEDVALMEEGAPAVPETVHATTPLRRQDIRADFFETVRKAIVGPATEEVPA